MCLVRTTHADDELTQLRRSHSPGAALDGMLEAITIHHEMVRASNPRWLLDLLRQLPVVSDSSSGSVAAGEAGSVLRLVELRQLALKVCRWWT